MRLTELRNACIRSLDGERLGLVHEVHSEGGRIVALICGPASLLERLTAKRGGRRIPWECVRRIADGDIFVTPDPPQRKPKKAASASRSRQGTRRPSAPRSRR